MKKRKHEILRYTHYSYSLALEDVHDVCVCVWGGGTKRYLQRRMDVWSMDGNVWMTVRMTFSETNDATTEQKLHVIMHVMAS